MNGRTWAIIGAALALSACQNMPEPYAPPAQRQALSDFRPYHFSDIVDMGDADAPRYFVRDITGVSDGTWRWTNQKPAVKVRATSNQDVKYLIDFGITDATFSRTGPVTVTFLVSDHVLGSMRCAAPGNQHF